MTRKPGGRDVPGIAMNNLRDLFRTRRLRVAVDPTSLPAPDLHGTEWSRVEGMLLGLAIGDSLGNTSESLLPGKRRAVHGEIRDYLPNRHAGNARVGLPSDDTCGRSSWLMESRPDWMRSIGGVHGVRAAA